MRRTLTDPGVARRFVVLALVAGALLIGWVGIVRPYLFDTPPGDFETRQGDILLGERDWERAVERFDAALVAAPDHRGALMGKAIALLQSGRTKDARAVLDHLIATLERTLAPDDPTGRGVLAGAYANRGILRDRAGDAEAALADYRRALAIDPGAVEGPGIVHRILYGNSRPSSVEKRAAYLEQQLALPESERVLRIPDLDARQRMHKP